MSDDIMIEVLKFLLSAGGGIAVAIWVTRGYVSRLEKLEQDASRRDAFCQAQQAAIIKEVSDKLCSSFRELMGKSVLDQTVALAEINKNIALTAKDVATMKEDITEIFARLNRRRTVNPADTGQRRRYTDSTGKD